MLMIYLKSSVDWILLGERWCILGKKPNWHLFKRKRDRFWMERFVVK